MFRTLLGCTLALLAYRRLPTRSHPMWVKNPER